VQAHLQSTHVYCSTGSTCSQHMCTAVGGKQMKLNVGAPLCMAMFRCAGKAGLAYCTAEVGLLFSSAMQCPGVPFAGPRCCEVLCVSSQPSAVTHIWH
jgi:hypothetical protein